MSAAAATPPLKPHTEEDVLSEGLIRIPEAAELLSLARSTVYQLLESGRLPYVRFGRSRRIPRAALRAFIAANLVNGQ